METLLGISGQLPITGNAKQAKKKKKKKRGATRHTFRSNISTGRQAVKKVLPKLKICLFAHFFETTILVVVWCFSPDVEIGACHSKHQMSRSIDVKNNFQGGGPR